MAVLALIFGVFLFYVAYVKIVGLLFRGKQHNRFFGVFISTIVPIIGSFLTVIMASKYEHRVKGLAAKFNDEILRHTIIVLQMLTIFMLFLPFFASETANATAVNLMFGYDIAGSDTLKPATFMIYLLVLPFLSAVINIVDRKYNIHNIVTYWFALFNALSIAAIVLVVSMDNIEPTVWLWMYCIVNVIIMLFAVFSLIVIRNGFLLNLENIEKEEYVNRKKTTPKPSAPVKPDYPSYKCSKCGQYVKKGTVCTCRGKHVDSLEMVMAKNEEKVKEEMKFCVYCRKPLQPGEVCNCVGDGYGISIKPEPYKGRRCKYCGQLLVGESICVCEKIMKKSVPADGKITAPAAEFTASDKPEPQVISDELEELEKKINQKFEAIKVNLSSEQTQQDDQNSDK